MQWADPASDDPVELVTLLEEARAYLRSGKPGPAMELAADYVDFVDPRSPGSLARVRFQDLKDPAARRLRYEVGLPVPRGYVFMRRYLTSGEMPDRLRKRFARYENAAAMTVWCRYVAVAQRVESERSWAWSSPQAVNRAISHEMVHAYVNSLLGPRHLGELPKWFQEGCAIYFGGGVGWELSREYKRYLSVFRYIAAAKGSRALSRFVRSSVLSHSVQGGLAELGFDSEDDLMKAADSWARGLQLKVQLGIAAFLALAALAAVSFVRKLKRRGEIEDEDLAEGEDPDEE